MAKVTVTEIKLHQQSRVLEVHFSNQQVHKMECEYLRVYSPSAEVMGHGPGQGTLQLGKEDVNIVAVEPVGNYAVKLVFDDGHNSGLYSWEYLYDLAQHHQEYWKKYLDRLAEAGYQRKLNHLN